MIDEKLLIEIMQWKMREAGTSDWNRCLDEVEKFIKEGVDPFPCTALSGESLKLGIKSHAYDVACALGTFTKYVDIAHWFTSLPFQSRG